MNRMARSVTRMAPHTGSHDSLARILGRPFAGSDAKTPDVTLYFVNHVTVMN